MKMSEITNNINIFCDFLPNLNENLRQNIKSFHISGYPLLGYYVLNDNKVYGYGKEIHDILGYNKIEENYVIISELNDKNIQEFYQGYYGMFARNDKNEIYSWGANVFGQLARGFRNEWKEFLTPEKISFFDGKNVIQITCGSNHCLAISSSGLIYGWGYNGMGSVGCGKGEEIILTPKGIKLKEKIKFIQCTGNMSFAVSFCGNAYYWGEIGYNNEINFNPKLIPLKNVFKVFYYSRRVFIILDNFGQVFEYNFKNGEIFHNKSEVNFNDLYSEEDYCILQSEECVYLLKDKKLTKTDFFNFYDYCLVNERIYNKTIETSKEGYLMKKEIHYNKETQLLVLKNEFILNKKCNENQKLLNNQGLDGNLVLETQIKKPEINSSLKKEGIEIINEKYENNFQQIREISSGAFSKVFEAKQISDKILYAIKRVEIKNETDFLGIQFISELKSDFIVQYIDWWIEENLIDKQYLDFIYIKMELCSHNLKTFLKSMNETLDENFKIFQYFISCELFKELIECVNYLHSLPKHIIQRDLKPENILISENSQNERFLKLYGFGVGKIHEKSSSWSRFIRSIAITTMSPDELDYRHSDIYNLALIGTEIFGFENNVEEIRKHKTRKDFDKYLSKYLNTNLETKFRQLLENLLNCLLPMEYPVGIIGILLGIRLRTLEPDCQRLLDNYKEFSIDKSIVLNEENISEFQSFLENPKNNLLKKFFRTKLSK